jgi:hypothetical protein
MESCSQFESCPCLHAHERFVGAVDSRRYDERTSLTM